LATTTARLRAASIAWVLVGIGVGHGAEDVLLRDRSS